MKSLRHILKQLHGMKSNRREKLHGDWRNKGIICISYRLQPYHLMSLAAKQTVVVIVFIF